MKTKVKATLLHHLSEIRCLTSFSTMEILSQTEVDESIQKHCNFIEQVLLTYSDLNTEVEEEEMEKLWLYIHGSDGSSSK